MASRHEAGIHGNHCGAHHGFPSAEIMAAVLDDPARDAWQCPERVIEALDLTPAMTIADVGAGTGYFAVRLARAVPEGGVIATDTAPDMVRYLNARARLNGLTNLRAMAVSTAMSSLAAQSVDRILVVHVWHHLVDRVAYASEIAAALAPGGRLYIVEFAVDGLRGPPPSMRVDPAHIIAELDAAGLVAEISPVTLPDQYMVVARHGSQIMLSSPPCPPPSPPS